MKLVFFSYVIKHNMYLKWEQYKDYCGDAEKYGHEIVPLKTPNSHLTVEDIADAAQPSAAFKWDTETDMKVDG